MTDSKLRLPPAKSKRRPKQKRRPKKQSKRQRFSSRESVKPKTKKTKAKISELEQGRLWLVWGVLMAGIVGLGWNLYQLQIVQGPLLEKKARQQQMVSLRPYIPRRSVIERQNNVLAADRLVYSLYVHPKLFKKSKAEIADKLGKILPKKTPEDLLKQFNKRPTGIRLAYALPEALADQVSRLRLDGVELIQHYSRFYPQQNLVSNVIGYVDRDHNGQAGIEYSQQQLLERNVLTLRLSKTGNGALMPTHLPEGLMNFDELKLKLTLDLRLQRAARHALKQQMNNFNAKRGAVIVIDVQDGSILSLLCEPTYDPNRYFEFNIQLFKNWSVTDLYEPGSTFKPINLAIALDAGVVNPNDVFYDSGKINIGRWPISNYDGKGNGTIGLARILQRSSNIGMVKIMSRMKRSDYYNALGKLGLGERMGI
ncbi:MAG: penicillin-binding protein 2, partial [Moorea sp. SIO2B7]|nr:penicillin-binding protein 2 [Moorena sp. SIO2B7]